MWLQGAGRRLQAGEYRFDAPMTPRAVVDKIVRGDVFLRPVTFREGLTIRQMAAVFEERGFGAQKEFIAAAAKADPVREIDPQAQDLEGYLFPDTYTLPRRTTADDLVARMTSRFTKALTPEIRRQAEARGLSVRELVTLASLVEKETAKPEERPLVAAVYANRLKVGMGMQCDPTVIYALERAGRYNGNLTRADLQFDSPYNTYRYAGLPPGPIAAPGPGVARGRRQSCGGVLPLLRQPQRRQPRVRDDARRAQSQRPRIPDQVFSASGGCWGLK